MPNVEKISIALPPEMVAVVRRGETGEYASSSEVVRDALRDWTQKRRPAQQGIDELAPSVATGDGRQDTGRSGQ